MKEKPYYSYRMSAERQRLEFEDLNLEEAEAWFNYNDATKGLIGQAYSEAEGWAFSLLEQRLEDIRERRSILSGDG